MAVHSRRCRGIGACLGKQGRMPELCDCSSSLTCCSIHCLGVCSFQGSEVVQIRHMHIAQAIYQHKCHSCL